MYESGLSLVDIGNLKGLDASTVYYHLKKAGTNFRPTGMWTDRHKEKVRGPKHHKWNGGRRVNRGGYVEVRASSHPRAAPSGYILEHRLTMERHLTSTDPTHPALDTDGYLRRDWVVHHVNGIKTDNRLVNLEPLPRNKHHSWLHHRAELERLRKLLDQHGIDYANAAHAAPDQQ